MSETELDDQMDLDLVTLWSLEKFAGWNHHKDLESAPAQDNPSATAMVIPKTKGQDWQKDLAPAKALHFRMDFGLATVSGCQMDARLTMA